MGTMYASYLRWDQREARLDVADLLRIPHRYCDW